MKRLALALLLTGCSTIRPARIGPRVEGLPQARQSATAQGAAIAEATAASKLTSAEIVKIRSLAGRAEGKSSVILQWLSRQERRSHETAP